MSTQDLPVGNPSSFLGELEEMDLSELKDQVFGVAISTGDRTGVKFIPQTLLAPLDFFEMAEAVGTVYEQNQLHAKAFILNKVPGQRMLYLDECTIDYLEARYMDIIADGMLSGALEEGKEFTCKAGFLEEDSSES